MCYVTFLFSPRSRGLKRSSDSEFDVEFAEKNNCIFRFSYFQNSWSKYKYSQLPPLAKPACTAVQVHVTIVSTKITAGENMLLNKVP